MLAAIFHDLGKIFVTKEKSPNKWSAIGHETISAKIVKENRDWIEEQGGNFELIYYLVSEHMRAKYLDEMRRFKREAFKSHKYYPYMEKFTEFDDMTIDFSKDL